MPGRYADVNGIKIHYDVVGTGHPVVLIHGFGSKMGSFMAQVPTLSKHFKVITLDNRGAGKSDRPDQPYTMEMYADDIHGLLKVLNINKAHLVGLSLGGMIALNFTLKYPHIVSKLVLINTLPKLPDNFSPESYIQSRIDGLHLMQTDPEKSFWQSTMFGFHHEFRRKMEKNRDEKFYGLWSVRDIIEYYKTDPPTPQDIRNSAHSLTTHDTYDKLGEIKHQTLLLTASHDRLVPKEKMLEIHDRMPNSKIVIIKKAGHESPKEKAPEVNAEIINFLTT